MTIRLIAWLDQWAGPIALQTAVAATLILVVALLVSWGLRRSAASLRHRVWHWRPMPPSQPIRICSLH